ncbi:MAG: NADPH--cytochrome reductase, partial [Chloroflexia bacterium]|nr:NADPH--cytochrome reductase [Chloroflexia bacterium]
MRARFQLPDDASLRIRSNLPAKSHLPLDQPVSIESLLSDYVELQDPATRPQIHLLATFTTCPPEHEQLLSLASDDPEHVARYREVILTPRVSLLDVLETYPSCALPFNIFLEMLSPLRPRYYSISSSALADPRHCTATVGVVEGPARSGRGLYHGACACYLATTEAGATVSALIQAPSTPFRPPAEPLTPVIMVGPGTGVAP